jgi:hypothetical protein
MPEITIFTRRGGELSKRIKLAADGSITITPAAAMTSGSARRAPIADVRGLAAVIERLDCNEAIALGALRTDLPDQVKVVTKDKLNGAAGVIARTGDFICYQQRQPAFVLLDFDAKGKPAGIVVKDFWATLVKVAPALGAAARVVRRSTSAGLHRTDTGEMLDGSGGMHIFITAQNGDDVERFLTTLHERCWLSGYGWIMVGKAGQLLERSIVDRSVGAPERLVFEAAPILTPPLAQDAESRRPIATDGALIDTLAACPPLTAAERATFDALVAEAKARIKPEADQVRAAYIDQRADELVKRTSMSKDAAVRVIESLCRGVLLPDVELLFVDKELKGTTVRDVLKDPERFEGRVLADPVEGVAYGRTTAKVLRRRDDGTPWIKSFAHGGVSYSLEREAPPEEEAPPPCSLDDAHEVYRKWLGKEYDLDVLDATLAAAAAERLTGDPLWLLVVGGPGAAKTETVGALAGAGAHVTSTIASEGALLSATSRKERSKNATGGLLRKIGERGVLVIKDVTSILSAARETRGMVLAAIREIYDGRWERNVGSDGGQTLTWTGRIVIVGAVTTAWDSAHAVVAAMGDRFVLLRLDSNSGRDQSGIRAIRNTGSEVKMREELASAVGGVIAGVCADDVPLSDSEIDQLVKAADIVTMARTAAERDYQGNIDFTHAPEMPTRFAKQLTQMVRGGIAIGMSRERAMELAIRCARDSIPPLRLEILLDVALHPGSRPGDVRRRIGKPWRTTKRELEVLTMLGMLRCDEESEIADDGGKDKTVWLYSLGIGFDRTTLYAMAGEPNAYETFAADAAAERKASKDQGNGGSAVPVAKAEEKAEEDSADLLSFEAAGRWHYKTVGPAPGELCDYCGKDTGNVLLMYDPFREVQGRPLHEECAPKFYKRERNDAE